MNDGNFYISLFDCSSRFNIPIAWIVLEQPEREPLLEHCRQHTLDRPPCRAAPGRAAAQLVPALRLTCRGGEPRHRGDAPRTLHRPHTTHFGGGCGGRRRVVATSDWQHHQLAGVLFFRCQYVTNFKRKHISCVIYQNLGKKCMLGCINVTRYRL